MQHLDKDLHFSGGERNKVFVLAQADLLVLSRAHTARLNRTALGQTQQLNYISHLGHVALKHSIADITVDPLELDAVQLDYEARLGERQTQGSEH